jgi:hypothetical protein
VGVVVLEIFAQHCCEPAGFQNAGHVVDQLLLMIDRTGGQIQVERVAHHRTEPDQEDPVP